ncbi:MAG: Cyclopropane-fatty-acyl-phospholipid synthase [Candidatus Accumulibacter regalis]|jgi:Cyclopropane fatty acid synthase and related methyltransferases|uniref:Cyclopropane-fatty-acyl-phospholipid synthase n=1 Tax=Accumulibacter regalis TaxID=522306 RepID=A0A011PM11_ACCRE|nr:MULTISPECIES: cyclopropane-fatty-acyl-phospholipid synthase family protein [unclassified Candidatus Accumulibacter]EXI88481.1 MAG: Cyclopropane-fatty-acyl-phospholipid synthase [Candidatus Accumulibacter regalis]MQM35364.1 class I SAM-dependent methyltransferase [Candidatus Accumulibacter phosphatis]MBL8366569.1 class I SAM-dependent methyltransferase [Accumulibacter sp.]HRE71018.1 cyclopropane-fatty-acyl-phospholipid synthase family protein [Accumulibacter sp.]HRF05300.1 cyclopropane-fatty
MNTMENTLSLPAASGRKTLPRSARAVLALLEGIEHGRLEVRLPDGSSPCFGQAAAGQRAAVLEVAEWSVFDQVLERGDVGFAEAWIDGDWQSPDLTALLTLLAENRQALSRAVYGHWWGLLSARLRHLLNANTRSGARRNIMAHYDLGNDFYGQWLDPTMSYSSALYSTDAPRSMAAAQRAKYRRILHRLDARPGQRVLEIGCGWGAFAETAAREAGLQVVGLTLSPAQCEFARRRMLLAGVGQQVQIELRDYRDLLGGQCDRPFDHIVSIEMFEAVGERWWPTYFKALQQLLAPGGRAVVQSITIADELFARYRRGTDFIQQHVFPGGMLPSPSVFGQRAARAGLAVADAFAFGRDYSRTLAEWSANFEQNWPAIEAQGFDERFRRLWRFYLAYCQAGFNSGATDVMQFELAHAR